MQVEARVLVIGGTRGTGREAVFRLLRECYGPRVLARDPEAARDTFPGTVGVVGGDITRPETLRPAVEGVDHLIFTAGVTQRPAGDELMKATNYDGIRNTLAAAREAGFRGRFLYMTTLGINRSSLAGAILDRVKRNTRKWRRLAEAEIRQSGLDYTILRAGVLTDGPAGTRPIQIGQQNRPLTFRTRISRGDVAEALVQALTHPRTCRTTFDIAWGGRGDPGDWDALFGSLVSDA